MPFAPLLRAHPLLDLLLLLLNTIRQRRLSLRPHNHTGIHLRRSRRAGHQLSRAKRFLAFRRGAPRRELLVREREAGIEAADAGDLLPLLLEVVERGFGAGFDEGEEGIAIVEELFALLEGVGAGRDCGQLHRFRGGVGGFFGAGGVGRAEDAFAQAAELGDGFGGAGKGFEFGGAEDAAAEVGVVVGFGFIDEMVAAGADVVCVVVFSASAPAGGGGGRYLGFGGVGLAFQGALAHELDAVLVAAVFRRFGA